MPEFVAMNDAVTLFLDSLKLSCQLNSIKLDGQRAMPDATAFCTAYKKYLPGLKNVTFSGSGFADMADDANNEFLYARLSTVDNILSIGVDGADVGDAAYFYKVAEDGFSPLVAPSPGDIAKFDISAMMSAKPLVRGLILSDGRTVWSTPIAPVAALASPAAPGNIDNGTHSYKVTFVNASGESAPSPTSNVITIVDKTVNGQATVTIQVGPSGTTARKVYRRVAGDTGNWKLLATVSNNTSTSY